MNKRIEYRVEPLVSSICDCKWNITLECPNEAEYLVRHKSSKMYSIQCGLHATAFFRNLAPEFADSFELHEWSLELNEKLAKEAEGVK